MDQQAQDRLARLFADVRTVIAAQGVTDAGLEAAGRLLAEVATEAWVKEVELAPKHGGASESRVLRSDGPDDLTLTLARFKEERATGVHDHGSWGVAVVVDGQDRYQRWERLDSGEHEGQAQLHLAEEVIAGPGHVTWWFDRPHDIHNQQGVGGPGRELVLFGRNTSTIPRRYFDPMAGTFREALPL
jgi:predicted metal-dependent enzyme (double-stranded beta helix superfamily)